MATLRPAKYYCANNNEHDTTTARPLFPTLPAMTEEYELPEIKKRESAIPSHRVGESGAEVVNDGAVNTWAYAATISYVLPNIVCSCSELPVLRLLALALPMILFPRVLLFLSETASERRNTLTPLESFLSMNLGILLVALAFSILFSASLKFSSIDCAH